jgi:hypothetical protein
MADADDFEAVDRRFRNAAAQVREDAASGAPPQLLVPRLESRRRAVILTVTAVVVLCAASITAVVVRPSADDQIVSSGPPSGTSLAPGPGAPVEESTVPSTAVTNTGPSTSFLYETDATGIVRPLDDDQDNWRLEVSFLRAAGGTTYEWDFSDPSFEGLQGSGLSDSPGDIALANVGERDYVYGPAPLDSDAVLLTYRSGRVESTPVRDIVATYPEGYRFTFNAFVLPTVRGDLPRRLEFQAHGLTLVGVDV